MQRTAARVKRWKMSVKQRYVFHVVKLIRLEKGCLLLLVQINGTHFALDNLLIRSITLEV